MVKKNAENEIIKGIDNKWELIGYIFKYRAKELLMVLCVILLTVIILKANGVQFGKLFKWVGGLF